MIRTVACRVKTGSRSMAIQAGKCGWFGSVVTEVWFLVSSATGRYSVRGGVPTLQRGNDVAGVC